MSREPRGLSARARERRSILVPTCTHGDTPIPAASRIGPFIATGNIGGFDAERGCYPEDPPEQARRMFEHLRSIVAAAGATLEEILKMTVYVRDDRYRTAIDVEWVKAFPNPAARPARQTILHKDLPAGRLMSCDVLAVVLD